MCKNLCNYIFKEGEIERLVELTKEPFYTAPSGLSREEKRKFLLDVANGLVEDNEIKLRKQ